MWLEEFGNFVFENKKKYTFMVSSSVYDLPDVFLTEERKRLAREPGNDSRPHSQPPLPLPQLSLLVITVLPLAPLASNLPRALLLCVSNGHRKGRSKSC